MVPNVWYLEDCSILCHSTDFPFDLKQGISFIWQDSEMERFLCGWWYLRCHKSWFQKNVCSQWGYQKLAFGIPLMSFHMLGIIPAPACAWLCIHGRCADNENDNSSHSTNWGDLTGCRHFCLNIPVVTVMCMIQELTHPCSSGDCRAAGCCVTGLGTSVLRGGTNTYSKVNQHLLWQDQTCRVWKVLKEVKIASVPHRRKWGCFLAVAVTQVLTLSRRTDQHHCWQ